MLYLLSGFSFGMVLFLVASGLTLIFGLMGVLNLAHGSFYLAGAYIGLAAIKYSGNFFAGVVAGAVALAIIGFLVYRIFLIRFYQQHLAQVLLTFGIIFIFSDVCLWIWGGFPKILPKPNFLSGSIRIGYGAFPLYRLFVIAVGGVVAFGLWWFQTKTPWGAIVRAALDDEEMTQGVGINTPVVCSLVFVLGSLLVGAGGVFGGPFLAVFPGIDFEILTYALAVIVIGGLGSQKGALVASILIGVIDNIGRALFPELAMFSIFLFMAMVLIVRPSGLFGQK